MVSDFRKKKLLFVFSFFDTDKSGSVSKADFELSAKKIAEQRGWKAGDAKYQETYDTLLKVWAGLAAADSDKDGEITQDEWIALWEKYGSSPADWQILYGKFLFQLIDATNDGAVDAAEFTNVNASWGIDKAASSAAFEKMAKGKASISAADYQTLYQEFFTSEDPNAAGNYIFVKTDF